MAPSSSTRRFTPSYREHLTLRNGTRVRLRLIRPDDKELLQQGFATMSHESRFARFFSYREVLSQNELSYLTELDYEKHLAIGAGAIVKEGKQRRISHGLGVARFVQLDDPAIAEAAVTVIDSVQGQGLGRILLERLVKAAIERGITTFRLEVLVENEGMLALVERLFPSSTRRLEDGVLLLDCPLPEPSTPRSPTANPPSATSMLYEVMRLAARDAIRLLRRDNVPKEASEASSPRRPLSELIDLRDDDGPGL